MVFMEKRQDLVEEWMLFDRHKTHLFQKCHYSENVLRKQRSGPENKEKSEGKKKESLKPSTQN